MCQHYSIYSFSFKQLEEGGESYENKIRRTPKHPPRTAAMTQIFPSLWYTACDDTSDTETRSAFTTKKAS